MSVRITIVILRENFNVIINDETRALREDDGVKSLGYERLCQIALKHVISDPTFLRVYLSGTEMC